jgi:hypothetical protein
MQKFLIYILFIFLISFAFSMLFYSDAFKSGSDLRVKLSDEWVYRECDKGFCCFNIDNSTEIKGIIYRVAG